MLTELKTQDLATVKRITLLTKKLQKLKDHRMRLEDQLSQAITLHEKLNRVIFIKEKGITKVPSKTPRTRSKKLLTTQESLELLAKSITKLGQHSVNELLGRLQKLKTV